MRNRRLFGAEFRYSPFCWKLKVTTWFNETLCACSSPGRHCGRRKMGTVTLREAEPADLRLVQGLDRQSLPSTSVTSGSRKAGRGVWSSSFLPKHWRQRLSIRAGTPGYWRKRTSVGFARVNWSVADSVCGRTGAKLQKIYLQRAAEVLARRSWPGYWNWSMPARQTGSGWMW